MQHSLQKKPGIDMIGERRAAVIRTWLMRLVCLALALCLTGTALADVRTLKKGMTGEDVAVVQQRLKSLGFYTGAIDGSFDSDMYDAVKLFQKANGISSTGKVASSTWTALMGEECVTLAEYNASRQLVKGDKGEEVLKLQRQLTTLGFYTGAVTGSFDTATRTAVKEFQTANGIKASGKATVETRLLLNSGKGLSLEEYNKVRPLKSGNKGDAVKLLQTQLKTLGYYTDTVDGKYDSAVKAAVKEFQTANGIKASGTADVATRTLINSGKGVTAAAYYRVCAIKSGSKGGAVIVLQQQLTALQFYDGALDGKYDTDVKNAVKAFQTANGVKASGNADASTRALMNSEKCVTGATYNLTCALKSGNSGVAVKVMQRRLKELGYYDGNIDGKYNSSVKTAVKEFQTANGIKANGTANTETRIMMNSGNAVTAAEYDKVRPLKSGNKGTAVSLLQTQLKSLGYYTGKVDGKYSSSVKTAVKTFQTANGIKATGTADVETRGLLNSGKGVTAAEYDKVRLLQSGNKGDAVKLLQTQLTQLGYFVENIDGKYGSSTKKAVAVLQTANGIKSTGKADMTTRILINSGKAVSRSVYDATRTLKKGEVGSTVYSLQNRLIALGYMSGTANGKFESSTQKAIKLFQEVHGLKETGTATIELRALLFSSDAMSYADYEKIRPIKSGEKSEAVRLVQTQLKQLGYFTDTVDGRYDSAMKKQVVLFQAAHGLKQNGSLITTEMRELLNSGKCISLQTYYQNMPLESGDKGDAVTLLQTRLKILGYFTDTINGKYGSSTVTAVKVFQLANSLDVTGRADTMTRVLMNSNSAITKEQYDANQQGGSSERAQRIERMIEAARAKLGCKYVHNTSGPNTFDCSGFTKYCFAQIGIDISGSSYNQGYLDELGEPYVKKVYSFGELQRGDLLIFDNDNGDGDLSDHTGLYLGNGEFIHASSAREEVIISNLLTYTGDFSWAFRLL